MKSKQTQVLVTIGALGILGVAAWKFWPVDCELSTQALALRDEARALQNRFDLSKEEQTGRDAVAKWQTFKAELDSQRCSEAFQAERFTAERNIAIIEANLIDVPSPPPPSSSSPPPPPPPPPLVYPAGRHVQALSTLEATGSANFSDWGVEGLSNFAYQYRAPIDSRVISNDGKTIVYQQTFGDVVKLCAIAKQSLALAPLDSQILSAVAAEFDGLVGDAVPGYFLFRGALQAVQTVDPRLQRTLTKFLPLLRSAGVVPPPKVLEIASSFEELSGTQIKLTYTDGIGIVNTDAGVDVISKRKVNRAALQQYVYQANVAADYLLEQKIDKNGSKEFKADAADIRHLIAWNGYDVQGHLDLLLEEELDDLKTFKITGGRLNIIEVFGGQAGVITPIEAGSYLKFDKKKHLATEAKIGWKIETAWKSTDHLFFQAKSLSTTSIESHYAATLLEAGR